MRDWRHNNSVPTPYFGSCGVLMMYTSQIYTFMLYTSSLLMWYGYVGDMGGFWDERCKCYSYLFFSMSAFSTLYSLLQEQNIFLHFVIFLPSFLNHILVLTGCLKWLFQKHDNWNICDNLELSIYLKQFEALLNLPIVMIFSFLKNACIKKLS